MRIVAACLSAVFAGITAILSKCGVKNANSDVATAVCTAIQNGQVSIVVPVDKLSILITVLFSLAVFKEKLKIKAWAGLLLLTAGTILMAVFT